MEWIWNAFYSAYVLNHHPSLYWEVPLGPLKAKIRGLTFKFE